MDTEHCGTHKSQQKDSIKCNQRTYDNAVDSGDLSVASSMFNVLSVGAYNQQGSKVRVWGDKKHEVTITTSLTLGFFPLYKNVLIYQLPVRGKTKQHKKIAHLRDHTKFST